MFLTSRLGRVALIAMAWPLFGAVPATQQAAPEVPRFVLKWGREGTGDGEFQSPFDVTVSPNNTILVLDSGAARIQIFDENGRFLSKFGSYGSGDGQFLFPQGVA